MTSAVALDTCVMMTFFGQSRRVWPSPVPGPGVADSTRSCLSCCVSYGHAGVRTHGSGQGAPEEEGFVPAD